MERGPNESEKDNEGTTNAHFEQTRRQDLSSDIKRMDAVVDTNHTNIKLNIEAGSVLEETIKKQIIPQLYGQYGPGMISRKKRPKSLISKEFQAYLSKNEEADVSPCDWYTRPGEADEFLTKLTQQDQLGALAILQKISERGATFTDICLGIIDEAAKSMNCQWENDDMSFIDVSLTTACMKQVVREFSQNDMLDHLTVMSQKAAYVTAMPGDGHNLGAQIIEEMFKRVGWSVFSGNNENAHAISVNIRKRWFTLAGISISNFTSVESCRSLVEDIRSQSKNPNIIVMVGGYAVKQDRKACEMIGADVLVHDARHALSVLARIENAMEQNDEITDGQIRLSKKWMNVSRDHKYPSLRNL